MKTVLLGLLFVSSLHAASSEDRRLKALIDGQWRWAMTEFPEYATSVGYPGQDHRWTDYSPAALERRRQRRREVLKQARAVKRERLSEASRLNRDLFVYELEQAVESDGFPEHLLALSQLDGAHVGAADTLASMGKDRLEDFKNRLARLEGLPLLLEQQEALLKEGLARGITPPRVTLRQVPGQVDALLTEDAKKNPLTEAFFEAPLGDKALEPLRIAAGETLGTKVIPALRRWKKFLEEVYLPGCRESTAFSALPRGADWYAFKARQSTTTKLTPQEIHDLGLKEVARIRALMEQTRERAKFSGDLPEFFTFLRKDSQFFFEKPEALVAAYREIAKRIDYELPRLFGKLPRQPYGVLPIPEYAEKSSPTAYYRPGAAATGRAGAFFANTYDLKSRPKWEMEALTLHEAAPGHHLQIALAQEQTALPEFRRHGGYTAYVEGWGLYAESLGEELGLYATPYDQMGRLTYEMWRAIRLVVDTGMHSLGWSRDRAIAFFKDNAGKAEHDIVVEIDRYLVWPGQALAYKVGELKFQELKRRARQALGEKFDPRTFHDHLLEEGALPLDTLQARFDRWLGAKGTPRGE